MERFTNGTKETRDRKLHMMLQLGPSQNKTFASSAVLKVLGFLFSLTRKGRESPLVLEAQRDRFPLPAIRVKNYSETYHFGGALQTDPTLPKNYVAVSSVYQSNNMPNFIARLLFARLERGALENNIVDFTFVLEGEQEDELPERALCTVRMVHVALHDVAHPVSTSALKPVVEPEKMIRRERFSIVKSLRDVVSIMGSPMRGGNAMRRMASSNGLLEDVKLDEFVDALNYVDSDDPLEVAANELTDLLSDTQVPVRMMPVDGERNSNFLVVRPRDEMTPADVLDRVTRDDMKRFFVAADCDLKNAAVRIVETTAWRGMTFPVDKRKCRIELENGQFFQQGRDLQGRPVFYFRNMCLGPWRNDVESVISAVLYRFDKALRIFSEADPALKFTLIILMGKPYGSKKEVQEVRSAGDKKEKAAGDKKEDEADDETANSNVEILIANPRIGPSESLQCHTNTILLQRLMDILSAHYPERLGKALVVPGKGNNSYYGVLVGGRIKLNSFLSSSKTRNKVHFLKKKFELKEHVAEAELINIVGGTAAIDPAAFAYV
jgi:hypothetical protein